LAQYYVWSNHEGWHLLLTDADLVQYCCGPTSAHLESLVSHLQAIAPGTVLHQPPPADLLVRAGVRQLVPVTGIPYLLLADREEVMAGAHADLDAAVARGDALAARLVLARLRHLRGEFGPQR